jgi:hypothetical protein
LRATGVDASRRVPSRRRTQVMLDARQRQLDKCALPTLPWLLRARMLRAGAKPHGWSGWGLSTACPLTPMSRKPCGAQSLARISAAASSGSQYSNGPIYRLFIYRTPRIPVAGPHTFRRASENGFNGRVQAQRPMSAYTSVTTPLNYSRYPQYPAFSRTSSAGSGAVTDFSK